MQTGQFPQTTVGEALAQYYVAKGLPFDGGANAPWFSVHIGPLSIRLPNPPARRRAVFFHDSNHLLTDYDTVFSRGEMMIAGFELASGCGSYWFAWFINFMMFGLGVLTRPREVYRAFLRGRHCISLYELNEDQRALSGMPIAALRAHVGIDTQPAPRGTDSLVFATWTLAVVILLVAIFGVIAWVAFEGFRTESMRAV